jgi:hypothetical protein
MNPVAKGLAAMAVLSCAAPASAQVIYSGAGGGTQVSVDAFRAALGPLNPNTAGSFGGGRREINWDGVPNALAAPNNLPAVFFNVNSPRGVVLSTPGTGFQVSGAPGFAPIEFDNINPTYSSTFTSFSPLRLFTAIDSNIVDVNFFVPGSTDAALVRGFGSVFSDVDVLGGTTIQFFGLGGGSLGTFVVPNIAGGNETLSFLGVDFFAPIVSRVRITSGTSPLGPVTFDGSGTDLVVMDDFIFGEPLRVPTAPVPEPATWALLLIGLGLSGQALRRGRGAWRQAAVASREA